MTRDDFKKQSDELFFKIHKSLCEKIIESAQPVFDKAAKCPDTTSALRQVSIELSQMMSTLCFKASCDYSEKLSLLLFDQFSKKD